jgi:hypothetical protein
LLRKTQPQAEKWNSNLHEQTHDAKISQTNLR